MKNKLINSQRISPHIRSRA
jgi:hypothetical protein